MLVNHREANTKFIAITNEALQIKLLLQVKKLSETKISQIFTKFTKSSEANCSSLANYQMFSNQEEESIKFITVTREPL